MSRYDRDEPRVLDIHLGIDKTYRLTYDEVHSVFNTMPQPIAKVTKAVREAASIPVLAKFATATFQKKL